MVGIKYLIIFALLLAACTSHTAKTDGDTVVPDGDVSVGDDAVVVDDDTPVGDDAVVVDDDTPVVVDDDVVLVEAYETLTDGDVVVVDATYCVIDENPDADIVYIPNTHTGNELCPDLAAADFPYYDTDGTIHFCRQCDEVRENDPQCVRNLWIDANEQLCTEKPQYDCWDYPCDMSWLRPTEPGEQPAPLVAPMHECDLQLNPQNPNGWLTGIATFKHFNLSENHIGFSMNNIYANNTKYFSSWRAFEYDISVQQYLSLGVVSGDMYGYYRKNSLFTTSSEGARTTRYLVYVSDNENYRIVYNEPIRIVTYNPALNDTWVFVNINDGMADRMRYAKIGEWQWTNLGDNTANEPWLVGNHLIFYTNDMSSYVCDLSLSPQSVDDCLRINRENEYIRTTTPDMENGNLIYFENKDVHDRLYRVDLSQSPLTYEELPLQEVESQTIMNAIMQVRGNVLLYTESFSLPPNSSTFEVDVKLCYYRIDEKKSYCMKPMDHYDSEGNLAPIKYYYGYAEFGNENLVWQAPVDYATYYRDMDCYCEKEGVCPFEGLK